jgi:hypothetical protein
MAEIEESEPLKQSIICTKKQFFCATSVKTMHWQVTDILTFICFLTTTVTQASNEMVCFW